MVLKYANGGNLHNFLRNNFENNEYKLKFVRQICFAKDIAFGLKFLHKEGIIHYDLHSKNILIHNHEVKIADLGLSKLSSDATKTRTGELKDVGIYLLKKRPQINEVYDIVSNIKSEVDKKFDENIKVEQYKQYTIEHQETILAYFYMKGFGTSEDYTKYLYWCNIGCEKKDVYSYYEAAFCYRYNLGTSEDYKKAFHYFNLAASGGVLKAKHELAIMYMDGMGCEENKIKAFCLFKETGEQDNIACCTISDWYYEGIGIQ
ncbi:kinase-like domain-containing protein [Gigaspora rosea]|uniref:Kinase-like domain-containing protein n=1 Tax=Gigaspora rosea TaxID=44941 RepID=A0A397UBZ4_9GLOM|nr:kinase-like domain-containing protein [Gigaspora rosea]